MNFRMSSQTIHDFISKNKIFFKFSEAFGGWAIYFYRRRRFCVWVFTHSVSVFLKKINVLNVLFPKMFASDGWEISNYDVFCISIENDFAFK